MKWNKLTDDAVIPQRGTKFSAGYDLVSTETKTIYPGQSALISTGIGWEPTGDSDLDTVGLIWPRSGMAVKEGVDTGAGVIDADYGGEIKVLIRNTRSHRPVYINEGDRIAQLVLQKFGVMEGDTFTLEARHGGFGSTGK